MTLTLVNLADQDAALPFPWSRIKRTLDSLEARFVRSGLRLQSERVQALRPVVEEALRRGLVPATIDLEGNFLDLVEAYVGQVLVEGIVQGDADVRAEERRARAAGVNLKVDGEAVIPKEAIAFLESRRDLNRFFDADQVEKVRTILGNSLREGATVKQTMDALQTALPGASRARLENIARTEATAAYNQGRVYRFLQSKGFIQAVRFDAILDSRVTDICQHRNGLLFALDDPRLRQNTPPLHYQCRSVLTPISGYKLEKMGGKARLDADRAKMDDAPGPQVTKTGRFGNEPWPDVQGGGGAAPMPRAKPVGPKGPAGESVPAAAQKQHPKVDLLPAQATPGGGPAGPVTPGKTWLPKEKEQVQHPSGLRVYEHPSAGQGNGVAGQVLKVIGGLPQGVRDTLQKGGVRAWFMDEASFLSLGRRPGGMRLNRWQQHLRGIVEAGAVTLTDFPRPGDVTMVFVTNRLAARGEDAIAHAARHETGHALHRSITMKGPRKQRRTLRNALREAFEKRSSLLPKSFHTSPAEHLAEGFDWRHGDNLAHAIGIQVLAPTLSGIVGSSSEVLALMESLEVDLWEKAGCTVLYFGPEGFAVKGPDSDEVLFSLNIGNGQEGETLRPDGTILTHGGGSKKIGHIRATWPTLKVWTPEEAEPYKAFLRSKGVTLPHVTK